MRTLKKNKQMLLWVMLLACQILYAQPYTMAVQGGTSTSGMGQVQWTIGETLITKFSGANTSVYEGIQQGLYASEDALVRDPVARNFEAGALKYYPNPVVNYLTIEDIDRRVDRIMVYDASGNEVYTRSREETSQLLLVNMETLPTGIYFVRLYDGGGNLLQRFRVVRQGR